MRKAKAAGKVVGVGTRVLVTFDDDIRGTIGTLEVVEGGWGWV